MLELCRYIVLNPLRTGLIKTAKDWKWSSYPATAYPNNPLTFLTVDWVLGQFAATKAVARKAYKAFITDGLVETDDSPWKKLVGQIIFGGDTFAAEIQERIRQAKVAHEIPRSQRFPGRPPLEIVFAEQENQTKVTRNSLITKAHIEYSYTLKEIADQLAIHYTTVSKVIKVSQATQGQS